MEHCIHSALETAIVIMRDKATLLGFQGYPNTADNYHSMASSLDDLLMELLHDDDCVDEIIAPMPDEAN